MAGCGGGGLVRASRREVGRRRRMEWGTTASLVTYSLRHRSLRQLISFVCIAGDVCNSSSEIGRRWMRRRAMADQLRALDGVGVGDSVSAVSVAFARYSRWS